MKTKDELLFFLENNKGHYISGEEIASALSISRTAVWKAISSLKDDGYIINAVRNKGYMLSEDTDIISVHGIRRFLTPLASVVDISVYPVVTSTNTLLKELASAGAPEGTIVIAGMQTQGKGRIGRSFYSPSDTGVYISILLRPGNSSNLAVRTTTMAAVAACEAIEDVSEKNALIKWVNDIYIDGKKVSGILTEASFGLEDGHIDYAVLGIGFNAYYPKDGFPDEIESIATVVYPERKSDGKNLLAAHFINHFFKYYKSSDHTDYTEKYRKRSLVIGKEINILYPDRTESAVAIDVDDECHLVVRYPDGTTGSLSTGEISIRIK